MIDIEKETLLAPAEVARLPMFRRHGRAVNVSTVWRWITHGVRARSGRRVRLESIKMPSGSFSSAEAAARFVAALNHCDSSRANARRSRERALWQVEAELAAAGIVRAGARDPQPEGRGKSLRAAGGGRLVDTTPGVGSG